MVPTSACHRLPLAPCAFLEDAPLRTMQLPLAGFGRVFHPIDANWYKQRLEREDPWSFVQAALRYPITRR